MKFPRKYAVFFFVIILGIFTNYSFKKPETSLLIERFYEQKIKDLSQKIILFQQVGKKKENLAALKKHFIQCRLSYKKLAVFTEYFNLYETKLLNGPALDWTEPDSPDVVFPPVGFQAIEQLLYSDWNATSYRKLENYLKGLKTTLNRLENEPDKIYKFKEELVWDALRSATLRIITMGITGFDSPVAKLSLPEATASLTGIQDILKHLKNNQPGFDRLFTQLSNASLYIKAHPGFDNFDRLLFITNFADPLYKQLNKVRIVNKIGIPEGANPVNFNSNSIFDSNAFDINFFSPAKEYWATRERVELGKKLFYDKILSGTKTRNCASCHQPEKAFTDGLKTPFALDTITPLLRNSPTLLNSVFQTKLFYDSRVSLLEGQLDAVIHDANEMKGSLQESVIELKKIAAYTDLFQKAYPDEPESLTTFTITNAISSYIRSLLSLNSRFDKYMRGDKKALSIPEKNGFNLFAGKAKCATCHYIPLFNGLIPPIFNETESEVLGVPQTKDKKNPVLDPDRGKFDFTTSVIHRFAFKTPTLRNIELTAPYMHNGIYSTLEEVMEFYNHGGGKGLKIAPENQTLPFDKLNLSKKEINAVVSFMKTLTDTSHTSITY